MIPQSAHRKESYDTCKVMCFQRMRLNRKSVQVHILHQFWWFDPCVTCVTFWLLTVFFVNDFIVLCRRSQLIESIA